MVQLMVLEGHTGSVLSCGVNEEGTHIVSCGESSVVLHLQPTARSCRTRVCVCVCACVCVRACVCVCVCVWC